MNELFFHTTSLDFSRLVREEHASRAASTGKKYNRGGFESNAFPQTASNVQSTADSASFELSSNWLSETTATHFRAPKKQQHASNKLYTSGYGQNLRYLQNPVTHFEMQDQFSTIARDSYQQRSQSSCMAVTLPSIITKHTMGDAKKCTTGGGFLKNVHVLDDAAILHSGKQRTKSWHSTQRTVHRKPPMPLAHPVLLLEKIPVTGTGFVHDKSNVQQMFHDLELTGYAIYVFYIFSKHLAPLRKSAPSSLLSTSHSDNNWQMLTLQQEQQSHKLYGGFAHNNK